jgi:hypothetical protein
MLQPKANAATSYPSPEQAVLSARIIPHQADVILSSPKAVPEK